MITTKHPVTFEEIARLLGDKKAKGVRNMAKDISFYAKTTKETTFEKCVGCRYFNNFIVLSSHDNWECAFLYYAGVEDSWRIIPKRLFSEYQRVLVNGESERVQRLCAFWPGIQSWNLKTYGGNVTHRKNETPCFLPHITAGLLTQIKEGLGLTKAIQKMTHTI